MSKTSRLAPVCATFLLVAACGGGGSEEAAKVAPPSVEFDLHIINPEGARIGHYTSGKVTEPVKIDAIDRVQIVAQTKDTTSGAKSIVVNATIQVACRQPDKTDTQLPETQKTLAQLTRASLAPLAMATTYAPATEMFGLKCEPPAVSGEAKIHLTAAGENFKGVKADSAPIDVIASLHP